MRSRSARPMILMALLLVVGVPLWGQSWAGRGRLQGVVKDENNKPMEGAKVTLRIGTGRVEVETDGPPSLTTDKNGKWQILGLAGGNWGVLIEKEGYMASEGQLKVNEFGPAQPVTIGLKPIPKEVIQKAQEESAAGQAKTALERANTLLNEGKFAEARTAYEEGMAKLTDDPTLHPAILRSIAMTYYREKNVNQAIETLKKSLALAPDDVDSMRLIASLLVEANREPEAQAYIAKLPAGAGLDPNTLLNVGIKSFNEGKIDQALSDFNRVVEQNPELPDAYYFRGLVYLNQGKNAEAKADFQKLLQLAPNHDKVAEVQEFLKELK